MLIYQVRGITAALGRTISAFGWTIVAIALGLIVSGCATSGNSEKISDHDEAVQQRTARMSDRL
jgi:hypothetical protein